MPPVRDLRAVGIQLYNRDLDDSVVPLCMEASRLNINYSVWQCHLGPFGFLGFLLVRAQTDSQSYATNAPFASEVRDPLELP